MRRDEVLAILAARREERKNYRVKSLAPFGSVAHDETQPDSDLDVLVEFDGPATFDNYMGLKFYLEDLLGARVDLVTWRALKPLIRPSVEREAVRVPLA